MRKKAPKSEATRDSYIERIYQDNKQTIIDAYNAESDKAGVTRKSEATIKRLFKEQIEYQVDQGYNLKEATENVGRKKMFFEDTEELFKYRHMEELSGKSMREKLRQLAGGKFVKFDAESVEFVEHNEKETIYRGKVTYGENSFTVILKRLNSPDEATGSYWEVMKV